MMKRILTFLTAITFTVISCAQVDTVNIGTTANDGTGESLRSAFLKVNDFMDVFNGAYLYHLTLAGDDALILTTSGATNVTLPTSGRLIASGDTASMLAPYVARGDTAAMLDNYATEYNGEHYGSTSINGVLFIQGNAYIDFEEGGDVYLNDDRDITITGGFDIGDTDDGIDSASFVGTKLALYTGGADTTATYIPYADRDDASTIFPTIQSAAGDTSNYDTPDKIGDLYIDTSAGKVYVSVAAARGGWRILNYFLPLFMFWSLKRRRRK